MAETESDWTEIYIDFDEYNIGRSELHADSRTVFQTRQYDIVRKCPWGLGRPSLWKLGGSRKQLPRP